MMMLPNDASFGSWSVATAVVLGTLLLYKVVFSSKHTNLPPGPRGLPFIGSLHLLGKHRHDDLAKLAQTYGPVMSIWLGSKLAVVASSPAAAEEFLKTQGLNFANRPKSSFGQLVLPADVATLPETPTRVHLKKILHSQVATAKQVQQSESVRTEEIASLLAVLPKDGTTEVSIRSYLEVVVTNILSRIVLKRRMMAVAGEGDQGLDFEQVKKDRGKFRELADELHDFVNLKDLGDFMPLFKWIDIQGLRRRMRKLRKEMDSFMSKIVSEHLVRRKSGSRFDKDFVDVLLDQREDKTLKFEVSEQNVNGVLWNALAAGTSTTIEAIEWAVSECIHNPHVMSKAQAELDAIVGKHRRVEDSDIPNLKYLQAIIKETFRLHLVPMLLSHTNQTACKVLGYDIPAGTIIMVNARAIARDPSIWEEPSKFKPERFLEGMPHANTDIQGNHFELLPFGHGRRGCPGMGLAIAMVHIQTATLLQSFDWSLPNNLQPKDLDMSEAPGTVPYRAQALSAIPKPRLSISPIVN